MKIGDLVRVEKCTDVIECHCFFCEHGSSCIGVVLGASRFPQNTWSVMFDCGEWELRDGEAEVINESR